MLVTTRISPEELPRIRCLPLDALQTEDAMALLQSFRPIADSPQDDEWKAALEIVGRLGGHALGVEVVAVYLRENPQVTYRAFAEGLQRDGIELMVTTAGPEAHDRLAWHTETCIRRLLEPTLASLSPAELRAVEYAAILPPDNLPLPWLRERLAAEFPERTHPVLGDPVAKVFQRLERLRLIVSQARGREPGAGRPPAETPAWPACTAWCRTWSAPGWRGTTSPAGRSSSTSSPTAAPTGSKPTGARWTSPGSCVPCATSRSA